MIDPVSVNPCTVNVKDNYQHPPPIISVHLLLNRGPPEYSKLEECSCLFRLTIYTIATVHWFQRLIQGRQFTVLFPFYLSCSVLL